MTYNNTATLIGNTGAELEMKVSKDGQTVYGRLTLYTQESYIDDQGERQRLSSVRHKVLAYDDKTIAALKAFKQGARVKVTGPINYRPFEVKIPGGETATLYEAAIVAKKVEQAALPKKNAAADFQTSTNGVETNSAPQPTG